MKPSDISNKFPYDSVFQNNESEVVAANISVILADNGDEFRKLPFDEYVSRRLIDGNFTMSEQEYFVKVVDYLATEESAKKFSPNWR